MITKDRLAQIGKYIMDNFNTYFLKDLLNVNKDRPCSESQSMSQ